MWPSLLDIGSCNSDRSYFLMTCSCNGKDKSMLIVTAKPAIVPWRLLMAAAMWPSLLDIGGCNSNRSSFQMACNCNGKNKSMLIATAKPAVVPWWLLMAAAMQPKLVVIGLAWLHYSTTLLLLARLGHWLWLELAKASKSDDFYPDFLILF